MKGLFYDIAKLFGFNAPSNIEAPEVEAKPILRKRVNSAIGGMSKVARKRLFLTESSRQGLLVAQARRKRKKNGRRPTFKEAGSKIKRIPQSAFGFKPHPKNL